MAAVGTKPTNQSSDFQSLESQEWYHGLRPKEDAVTSLRLVGDWLMRAVESKSSVAKDTKLEVILSVLVEIPDRIVHFALNINPETNTCAIATLCGPTRSFPSLKELIKFYGENDLPGGGKLVHAVTKPAWILCRLSMQHNMDDLIGKSNFFNVVKGKYQKTKTEVMEVALKICLDKDELEDPIERQRAADTLMREARFMRTFVHDNIIDFYGVVCDHPPIMIVMEFCPGGSLTRHLQRWANSISAGERIWYCKEIAEGLGYIHSKDCVHRDLASRNCLISANGNIKIADFGLSKTIAELVTESQIRTKDDVPVRWMAPETITRTPFFSKKSDAWSFGVTCFEIFNNGQKPWPEMEPKEVAKNYKTGKTPDIPSSTPGGLAEIIRMTWQTIPENRPDFTEIILLIKKALEANPPPQPQMFTLTFLKGIKMSAEKSCIQKAPKSCIPQRPIVGPAPRDKCIKPSVRNRALPMELSTQSLSSSSNQKYLSDPIRRNEPPIRPPEKKNASKPKASSDRQTPKKRRLKLIGKKLQLSKPSVRSLYLPEKNYQLSIELITLSPKFSFFHFVFIPFIKHFILLPKFSSI